MSGLDGQNKSNGFFRAHKDNLEPYERLVGKLGVFDKIVHQFVWIALFLSAYDPFTMYRKRHPRLGAKYDFYLRSELKLGFDDYDQLKKKWRFINIAIFSYLVVKYLSVVLVQVTTYRTSSSSAKDGAKVEEQRTTMPSTVDYLIIWSQVFPLLKVKK